MNCLSCHAETTNGLALCELCQRKARAIFDVLPVYFRNLARWRPGRAGSRPVPSSRVLYDGEVHRNDRVSRTLDEAGADLVGWAEVLADDRPEIRWPLDLADLSEAEQVIRLCEILADRLTSIATLEWGGEFLRSLSEHESILREMTEQSIPGWYAGACRHCGYATYVVAGLTWVTCGHCGATTYARDHLDTVLKEARPWVARPMRLAEAIVALVDTEMSVPRLYERIKKWEQRDKIEGIRKLDADGDPSGPKRYRLGDVLDHLFSEGATRLDATTAILPTEVA